MSAASSAAPGPTREKWHRRRRTMLHSENMEKPLASARLHDFFLRATEKSFHELGVGDESIVGYIASVLTEFARSDRLYPLRTQRGRAINGVGDMRRATKHVPEDQRHALRARALQKYVGDY